MGAMETDRCVKVVIPALCTIEIWESYFDDALAIMQHTDEVGHP